LFLPTQSSFLFVIARITKEIIMIWLGAAICVLVFVGIIFKFDTKLCLIAGGLLMCILSGKIGDVVPAYCASLINGNVVTYTCIAMGYAAIMTEMGCTDHLIYACIRPLSKVKAIVIPFSILVTIVITMGLQSAATVGVAAGSLIIPLLIGLGFTPATAAATVLQGTVLGIPVNPGSSFYIMACENDPSGQCTGKDIINAGFFPSVVVLIAGIALFMIMSHILEGKGEANEEEAQKVLAQAAEFKVNGWYAFLPLFPLILILLGVYGPLDETLFYLPACMFIGLIVCMITWMKDYKRVANTFFKGQGNAFYSIITLMAAAAVFTKGMSNMGITAALVQAMKDNPNIAKYGATFGPMLIAALSGSGNAAMIAFIESVLPYASEIGVDFAGLASVVLKTGNYGRTFSPVAAVTLVVCGIAKVDPMKVIKITVVPCLAACILTMLLTKM